MFTILVLLGVSCVTHTNGQNMTCNSCKEECFNYTLSEPNPDGIINLYLMHIAVWEIPSQKKPFKPSVDFIVDLVNNRSDLLPGYRLNVIHSIINDVSYITLLVPLLLPVL